MQMDAPQSCPSAYVVDGDTLRCGSIRLRLLGIDAPELPGHCAAYRECAPGDGITSKRSLIDALRNGRVTYSVITTIASGATWSWHGPGGSICPVGSCSALRRSTSLDGTAAILFGERARE